MAIGRSGRPPMASGGSASQGRRALSRADGARDQPSPIAQFSNYMPGAPPWCKNQFFTRRVEHASARTASAPRRCAGQSRGSTPTRCRRPAARATSGARRATRSTNCCVLAIRAAKSGSTANGPASVPASSPMWIRTDQLLLRRAGRRVPSTPACPAEGQRGGPVRVPDCGTGL